MSRWRGGQQYNPPTSNAVVLLLINLQPVSIQNEARGSSFWLTLISMTTRHKLGPPNVDLSICDLAILGKCRFSCHKNTTTRLKSEIGLATLLHWKLLVLRGEGGKRAGVGDAHAVNASISEVGWCSQCNTPEVCGCSRSIFQICRISIKEISVRVKDISTSSEIRMAAPDPIL